VVRFLNLWLPSRTVLLGISDSCLVAFAFIAASLVRLGAGDTSLMLSYENGFAKIAFMSAAVIGCMYYCDLYDPLVVINRREVIIRLIQVLGMIFILIAAVDSLYPSLELGRGIFLIGSIFVALLVSVWRKLFSVINSSPQFAEKALLLGDGPLVRPILEAFESRPDLGLRIVGQIATVDDEAKNAGAGHSDAADSPSNSNGGFVDLREIVRNLRINRIVVAMNERRGKLPVSLLLTLKFNGVRVEDGTDFYEAITGKVPIDYIRSGWLLFSPGFHVSRFIGSYKRLASLLFSIVGLLLSIPLLPFIFLVIWLSSPGPLLYRQRRVGLVGKEFQCYKFRTMRADAEADTGPTWAADDDPRITFVGRYLRKFRLDEIPQLWNVLKGDMSLIGPRPERPEFVERLRQEVPFYDLRHAVRPGITGWAQIRYRYGASVEDAKEKLRYDLFYIKHMSPGLDTFVLFSTFKIITRGRGAR
jgi:sugar transferase (PEP-CTERM system associated)